MLVYTRENGTAYVADSEPLLREHVDEAGGDFFTSIEELGSIDDLAGARQVQTVGDLEFDYRKCPNCHNKFALHHGPKCLRCGI